MLYTTYPMTYEQLIKAAAAILTPEAEQAAMQPPMDPSMGGMPQQGMPPQGAPMDPSMMGGMPTQGGQLPPEILQDQMFMQFLADAYGIMLDPNSGTLIDPQGQPVPPDAVMQIYQQFQEAVTQQQQAAGGMPQQGAPMDPSMMGGMAPQGAPMDPAMMGGMPQQGAPMDPSTMGGMPPQEMPQQGAPTDSAMAGGMEQAPEMGQEDPINQIAGAVMSGVESVLQEYTASTEKRISAILDKLEALTKSIDALQSTTDRREQQEKDADEALRADIAADLQPAVKTAKTANTQAPLNLFKVIQGCK